MHCVKMASFRHIQVCFRSSGTCIVMKSLKFRRWSPSTLIWVSRRIQVPYEKSTVVYHWNVAMSLKRHIKWKTLECFAYYTNTKSSIIYWTMPLHDALWQPSFLSTAWVTDKRSVNFVRWLVNQWLLSHTRLKHGFHFVQFVLEWSVVRPGRAVQPPGWSLINSCSARVLLVLCGRIPVAIITGKPKSSKKTLICRLRLNMDKTRT